MCGIAGIIAKDKNKIHASLQVMMNTQYHRGPDDGGLQIFALLFFRHQRALKAIGVSGLVSLASLAGGLNSWPPLSFGEIIKTPMFLTSARSTAAWFR